MAQSSEPGELALRVADLYLAGAITEEPAAAQAPHIPQPAQAAPDTIVTPSDLKHYAGAYHSEELDIAYTITVVDNQMFVKRGYGPKEAVTFITRDLFTAARQTLQFLREGEQIVGFALEAGRVKGIFFNRA